MNDEPRPDLGIPETYGRIVTRQFAKNRFAVSGLAIVIVKRVVDVFVESKQPT